MTNKQAQHFNYFKIALTGDEKSDTENRPRIGIMKEVFLKLSKV